MNAFEIVRFTNFIMVLHPRSFTKIKLLYICGSDHYGIDFRYTSVITSAKPDQVICTQEYSQEVPYSNGAVKFDVRGRFVIMNFASSLSLKWYLSYVF